MKLGIIFEAPCNKFEKTDSALAFASLRQQIITYAKAIEQDPNVMVKDAFVLVNPADYATRAVTPADPVEASAKAKQTTEVIAAHAAKAKAKAKDEPKGPVTPTTAAPTASKPTEAKVKAKAPMEAAIMEPSGRSFSGGFGKAGDDEVTKAPTGKIHEEDSKYVIDKIFKELKRTGKSVKIITALASTGEDMSIGEIATATGFDKNDVSSWLSGTAKNVTGVERSGHGKYKLNYAKVI